MKINESLLKIEKENAFSKSTRLVREYKTAHPDADVISLGIGDVSLPIIKPIIDAMKKACDDLSTMDHFQGYGTYYGLPELRKTILDNEYERFNFSIDEIYVSDGTKPDSTNILELFDVNAKILVGNPMYPIYQNGAFALSRNVYFASCDEDYKMVVPKEHYDIIYLCSPSNPIGNAFDYEELKRWVDYANIQEAVIIYDNVYHAFIESVDVPDSIYDIENAKTCCIEMRSFSKDLSFTGVRCSYFILPKEIMGDLNPLWKERTINRFNGACYIAQKGAIASYLPEVREQLKKNIAKYKENAKYLKRELEQLGFKVIGAIDSPYLWVETPDKMECWSAFKFFLEELNIITVPGLIFGSAGKYYLRLSSLGTIENSEKAIERIKAYYKK